LYYSGIFIICSLHEARKMKA